MQHLDKDTGDLDKPHRAVMVSGACIAVVLAGSVWANLLSGDHPVFERTAAAPAPVIATLSEEVANGDRELTTAGTGTNSFPAARVSVRVGSQGRESNSDDPLAQLILQTSGSDVSLAQPTDETPEPSLVLQAQREMAALGLFEGAVDGLPGADTRDAVRKYQALNGLPVTGIVTQPVLDHIQLANKMNEASETSVELFQVQQELAKLGYSPGQVDGRLGKQTRIAIRTFEADRGWQVTGEMSDALLQELTGSNGLASVAAN
jgi:peptidoglycan hydrolase-like protein with peptidoglycan-binding domain